MAAPSPATAPSSNAGLRRVHVAGFAQCSFYRRARDAVNGLAIIFPGLLQPEIHEFESKDAYKAWLPTVRGDIPGAENHTSSPLVWFNENQYLGGCDATLEWAQKLMIPPEEVAPTATVDSWSPGHSFDYDLVVIGGGSGGLACSKEAAAQGARVAVLDFVKPTVHGTSWGLGGTCVNVGCIPKKLMHNAAIIGETLELSRDFGWEIAPAAHRWATMVDKVQDYIKSLNFNYRVQLRDQNVTYLNKLGRFIDLHTLECTDKKGKKQTITSSRFVIAVGGRPTPLACSGAELAISSDDLFSLTSHPGKVCVVGAGYVALECAGFLKAVGCEVSVLVRSMALRGFDRDCADKIVEFMQRKGINIIFGVQPSSINREASGKLSVTLSDGSMDVFDTVLAAVGRTADTAELGLENVGILTNVSNRKISCVNEQTSVPNIYAIGDVIDGVPELTPVAIMAGKLLAQRLFGHSNAAMDYDNIPTTVFTPLEFGTVGLSEQVATERFGADDVDVYVSEFTPLEWSLTEFSFPHTAYAKAVIRISTQKVLGLHIVTPNAGEIIQGFAVAIRKGLSFADLTSTVGIHPTIAEEFTILHTTKRSGLSTAKAGC